MQRHRQLETGRQAALGGAACSLLLVLRRADHLLGDAVEVTAANAGDAAAPEGGGEGGGRGR